MISLYLHILSSDWTKHAICLMIGLVLIFFSDCKLLTYSLIWLVVLTYFLFFLISVYLIGAYLFSYTIDCCSSILSSDLSSLSPLYHLIGWCSPILSADWSSFTHSFIWLVGTYLFSHLIGHDNEDSHHTTTTTSCLGQYCKLAVWDEYIAHQYTTGMDYLWGLYLCIKLTELNGIL